jgi:hypothetical protein
VAEAGLTHEIVYSSFQTEIDSARLGIDWKNQGFAAKASIRVVVAFW